ncbi:MAG: Flp pilus assembly protein CpaB [Rhodobacteraceae bacterium]|nr:Flp pilus assembly protein CpaB [Paracoccaceae bacterium]
MRMVFGLVLIIGIALAGGAVYLAQGYIAEHRTALAKERASNVPLTDIVIAKEPLKYGDEISLEQVAMIKWPVPAVPEGAFANAEELFSMGENELRTVLRSMEKGEPILAVKVTEPGEGAGLTSLLEPGMRAFTIRVDVQTGVSGFLRPGDRVDIFWTGQGARGGDRRAGGGDLTMLIETAVELVAVDQNSASDAAETAIARTVTAQVTPQQVARLAQAQNSGRLSLALVGAQDTIVASAADVDQRGLLGLEEEVEEQVVEAEVERTCTIRTRRGAEVIEIPIPCTD